MSKFSESMSAILSKIAQWLGMKPDEAKRLELMKQKLEAARAANVDRLETLKDDIRKLERRALQKKEESEKAHGDTKRLVITEIEQVFRDIDRLRGREKIIVTNIDRLSTALAKIDELVVGRERGVDEDLLDDLALDLQEVFRDLRETDRAARDLERETYEAPEPAAVNVESRVGELEGVKEASTELSPATSERLKALVTEKE